MILILDALIALALWGYFTLFALQERIKILMFVSIIGWIGILGGLYWLIKTLLGF